MNDKLQIHSVLDGRITNLHEMKNLCTNVYFFTIFAPAKKLHSWLKFKITK